MRAAPGRLRIAAAGGALCALLAGCAPSLEARIDGALWRAAGYLAARQSPDGAWRSETYGAFRDGPSLTPAVLAALASLPEGAGPARLARERAASYLGSMAGEDGRIREPSRGFALPVYAAASAHRALSALSRTPEQRRAAGAWLSFLARHRLGRHLGWGPGDPAFGGWGYAPVEPRRPGPEGGAFFFESNLSATVFGAEALRAAGVPPDDPAFAEILVFCARCQNLPGEGGAVDPRFDDGGFFFTNLDTVRNKAGAAGTDAAGRERFHSYGSATADGLRVLVACGLPADHPRVRAARAWLEANFRPDANPGTFARHRALLRDSTYYYYAWTVSRALAAPGPREVRTRDGSVRWTDALAGALLARQRPDGSWRNPLTDGREDDPLIATALAAEALAVCRRAAAGE